MQDKILATIKARTNPALHHLVAPETLLSDLRFREEVDLIGLQYAVEEAADIKFPDHAHAQWLTVADVVSAVEWFLGVVV